ncbi:alcohol dehydrogenase GroES domain-containing protein [Halosimplex carlsbadense 2-9-1]|uniref:Alcohol dehydrogenase GroES domain-containing protein n=1 Tax=Halosimplex carlsbadense 2-9-1 TaxID=797114 RepID=M0CK45_9EURY|nr:alcohol dehydrogenase catalytic domain-containing protein [Halosimplex carlsbadense]ELZ23655.1 alcohol dehydrogenase GroES domain-containing protein [Halosimplex carlsbadense 2-9-1]
MRAVVLAEHGEPLELRDVPEPEPDPDGVVVETEACGICRSDWHAWQGHGDWVDDRVPTGQVLGHEPVGTVREVGADVETVAVGDRVVVPFSLADGTCPACRAGRQNYCEGATALGFGPAAPGAFAERFHVPAADVNAVHLPEGVSAVAAASMGCRFVTAFEALDVTADVGGGDVVAVVGCGGVGLSAVQIAAALGATPVAVDVREAPLELAADIGAAATLNAEAVDAPERVRERFGGADLSMDALGSAETFRTALDSLGSGGTHVQVGLTGEADRGEVALPVDRLVQDDLTVAGSRGMPPRRYDDIFAMVAAGQVDPGALVTDRVALREVPDRLAAMSDFDTVGVEVVTAF